MHDWVAFTVYSLNTNKMMKKIYTVTHSKTIKVASKNLKRQVHA